ncbi:MAG: PilZ domain-containing protein [Xanthobacteraceae bacterium]|nr:PilZ domain-containing protein [Xanthobacteraceae bacterium]
MPGERFHDLGPGRRKSRRRGFQYPAKVVGPDAVQWDGFIVDISDTGAQIEVVDAQGIPDAFSLLIGQGAVKRICQLVWRSGDRLGVKFVRQPDRPLAAPHA